MNILIGKLGKSVKFKNLQISTGGDTCLILYSTMSRMMPEHNFYFFGPNDLDKLTSEEYKYLFPNHNIFSLFVPPRIIGYIPGRSQTKDNALISFDTIVENIKNKNLHFDFALIFCGYTGNHTLCNCLKKSDGSGDYCIALTAFKNYAGPYVHVLNSLEVPIYSIAEDPRYITINANELFNRERLILTQMSDCDIKTRYKYITSYEDHTFISDTKLKCTYADTEKIFLMGVDKDWRNKIDIQRKLDNTKNPKCIVLSNGHGTSVINSGATIKNGRLDGYKEYIIDGLKNTRFEDTCIYGKWEEPVPQEFSQIQDRKIIDLDDEIADAKFSFVYSIVKDFVTIKPYEMIIKGLIPFIHPDYDSKHLLGLPDYLYVKDPNDFAKKMEGLDNDNEKYLKILNECFECIKPEFLDGSYVVNKIMHKISDNLGFDYTDHQGVPSILNHFGKQVFDTTNINK